MPSLKSPGGAMYPYYYKHGEIFGAHFDSFGNDETGLISLMQAEEEFFLSQNRPLPYWINFYGSKLTDKILAQLIGFLDRQRHLIPRLAIVGCSTLDQWRFKRIAKKLGLEISVPIKYFSDPEVAKTWLVSETF